MPMNIRDYPPDWRAISLRIRERDHWRCRHCAIPNGAYYYRDGGAAVVLAGDTRASAEAEAPHGVAVRRVVLTVAHWPDPDPTNCADDNLQSLCQQCHNRLDMPMRQQHATETRRRKRIAAGQQELEL